MSLPLDVLADLTLAVDGEDIRIQGDGELVVVDLPTLRAGRRLLQSGPWSGAVRQKRTQQFNTALTTAGITVDVRYQGDTIARVGARARPNAAARLLDLGDVEVRPGAAIRAEARSRPIATFLIVGAQAAAIAFLIARIRK